MGLPAALAWALAVALAVALVDSQAMLAPTLERASRRLRAKRPKNSSFRCGAGSALPSAVVGLLCERRARDTEAVARDGDLRAAGSARGVPLLPWTGSYLAVPRAESAAAPAPPRFVELWGKFGVPFSQRFLFLRMSA